MDTEVRTTKQVVTAPVGPSLPLLHDVGAEWPVYTGPLGLARLLVRKDRWLTEFFLNGKHNCFLSMDREGNDCREWSLSYVSMEQALRECLGVYFARQDFDDTTLRRALRSVLDAELNQLGEA